MFEVLRPSCQQFKVFTCGQNYWVTLTHNFIFFPFFFFGVQRRKKMKDTQHSDNTHSHKDMIRKKLLTPCLSLAFAVKYWNNKKKYISHTYACRLVAPFHFIAKIRRKKESTQHIFFVRIATTRQYKKPTTHDLSLYLKKKLFFSYACYIFFTMFTLSLARTNSGRRAVTTNKSRETENNSYVHIHITYTYLLNLIYIYVSNV